MKYPRKHIDRAVNGGDSGYAFKTLWQEATNALLGSMDVIKTAIAGKQKTEQLHDLYDIKGRQDWSIDYINATKSNSTGSSILFVLVVCAVIGGLIILAIKKPQGTK